MVQAIPDLCPVRSGYLITLEREQHQGMKDRGLPLGCEDCYSGLESSQQVALDVA